MLLPEYVKNKIISTFSSNDSELELEARFGMFRKNNFKPGVSRQIFNRVQAYFDKRVQRVDVNTVDYIMGAVRKTVHLNTNDTDIWITKNRLWREELKDYGIRYSMASENPVSPIADQLFIPTLTREKNRSSYLVFNNAVRIDLTVINNQDYEVEIELLDSRQLAKFDNTVQVVLRLILDTIVLYTQSMKTQTINEINSILGSSKRGVLDHYPLVQARNLKLKDMVDSGLIGNPDTSYSVTHKADGQRKMLYFSKNGIWLAAAPNSLMRVSDSFIDTFNGSILDGELIPVENRTASPLTPKSILWFLTFDTLAWQNNNAVNLEPHLTRLQYCQAVADKMKGNVITIHTKTFKHLPNPQAFFSVMKQMFMEQPKLTYRQDGFMFTPQDSVYNPHSDKNPLYRRILTRYPDICKWKPKEELTIDFAVRTEDGVLSLYSSDRGKMVPFEQPVDQSMRNLPDNTIVEYRYDYERELLVATRVRHDKDKPNRYEIALDVWNDIVNPIEEATLKGEDFTLLRKYHNRIKRELFNNNPGRYLLDIGSGRGGDILKWQKFDKIVAVEPNSEHIQELIRRLTDAGMREKVYILESGGEETERIQEAVAMWIGGPVDVISMMLSMTFFWQSPSLIDALSETIRTTIKPDGRFIFLTMDGDYVQEVFDANPTNNLKLGPATLQYYPDINQLEIDIKDSIVSDQTEWLVKLDELASRLPEFDFIQRVRADREKFLTSDELLMTSMYTYGVFEKRRTIECVVGVVEEVVVEEVEVVEEDVSANVVVGDELYDLTQGMQDLDLEDGDEVNEVEDGVEDGEEVNEVEVVSCEVVENPEEELSMLPMDQVQLVQQDWWHEEVVRIGCIGDGSCFFHATFNAYLQLYQTNPDPSFRRKFAKTFRKNIADKLSKYDPNVPGKIIYETASRGLFLEMYNQGVTFEGIDFSQQGLEKFFKSDDFVGDEVYLYVAELLDIDIYIMRITDRNLYPHSNTHQEGIDKMSIVISGTGLHFETIGVRRNELFQTFFSPNDPFILKIRNM